MWTAWTCSFASCGAVTIVGGSVMRFWFRASGVGKLCAFGVSGWRFCAAPQLHRYTNAGMLP